MDVKTPDSNEEGHQIHQDHPDTWRRKYEPETRTQSEDPKICCAALRTLSNWFGVGVQRKPQLDRVERFMYHILKDRDGTMAEKIKFNLPSDSSDEEEEEETLKGEVMKEEN